MIMTTHQVPRVGYLFAPTPHRDALVASPAHWIDRRGMGRLRGLGLYILLYEQTLFSIAS